MDIMKSDAYHVLIANKEKDIYYKIDHHWTTKGAYFVFKEWTQQVFRMFQSNSQMIHMQYS